MNVQTLRKLFASVSALTIVLSTCIVPTMATWQAQAALSTDEQTISDAVDEGSGTSIPSGRGLTRYEAAAMLAGLDQCSNDADSGLSDVDSAHAGAVNCVVASGYFHGTAKGTFEGNRIIHRDEFASVDARFAGVSDLTDSAEITSILAVYADNKSIDPGLRGAVAAATKAGLYKGFANGTAATASFFVPQALAAFANGSRLMNAGSEILTQHAKAAVMYAILVALNGSTADELAANSVSDNVAAFRVVLNLSTTPTPTPSGNVSVSVSATSPASRTIPLGTAKVDILDLDFAGTGNVTAIGLVKTSVANTASITNIYVYDTATGHRLTDGFSLNSNGTVTISVKFSAPMKISIVISVDGTGIATSGEELQLGVKSFSVDGTSQDLPQILVGGIFRLATAVIATFTTAVVTPSGGALNAGPDEQVLFQSTFTISQRDVIFHSMTFENIGSASTTAFEGLRLLIDGVEVATAVGVDENSRVVFMANPGIKIKQGARVIQVLGKLVAGAARTFHFSIRQPVDVDFEDPSVGVAISATVAGPIQAAVANAINGGTCTVIKDPENATSGQLILGATSIVIGRFRVKCYGEAVKANTITAGFIKVGVGTGGLRNGYISIGAVGSPGQQGGTATLAIAGTPYATNFIFEAGQEYEVDVVVDTVTVGGVAYIATDTIQATLLVGAANAQLQVSRGTINFPAGAVTGNTLTLATAAVLALTAASNYPSQNAVAPNTKLKIGAFKLSGVNVEDANITTGVVALGGTLAAANMVDLILEFNGKQAPVQSAVGAGGSFAISDTLKTNTTLDVNVYVTILAGAVPTNTIITTLTINGTTSQSGVAATSGAVLGQTITVAAGTITMSKGSNTPNASITSGNKTIVLFEGDMSTLNDSFILNGLTLNLSAFSTITSVEIVSGGTVVRTFAPAAATVLTGLTVPAAKNVHSYFLIRAILGDVGTSAGTSGENIVATIAAATALNANGTQVAVALGVTASNGINVYHDVPVITGLALYSSLLTAAGDSVAARFKVEGTVNGTVGWTDFTLAVNKTGVAGAVSNTGCYVKKLSDNTTVPGVCTSVIADTATAGTIVFNATAEETIPAAGESYDVHVLTAGAPSTGHTYAVTWANSGLAPAAPNTRAVVAGTIATLVWTDRSSSPHSLTSTDYNNDAFVKNLPISIWNRSN